MSFHMFFLSLSDFYFSSSSETLTAIVVRCMGLLWNQLYMFYALAQLLKGNV